MSETIEVLGFANVGGLRRGRVVTLPIDEATALIDGGYGVEYEVKEEVAEVTENEGGTENAQDADVAGDGDEVTDPDLQEGPVDTEE